MERIADILMLGGVLAAAGYCLVLSRRLRQLARLDRGMGAAIATLSRQVGELTAALEQTRDVADSARSGLDAATARADTARHRLEVLVAAADTAPPPPRAAPAPEHATFTSMRAAAPPRPDA